METLLQYCDFLNSLCMGAAGFALLAIIYKGINAGRWDKYFEDMPDYEDGSPKEMEKHYERRAK